MPNPFSGIITAAAKETFNNAIDALIAALSRPCEIVYSGTQTQECNNCVVSPISGKSTNKYKSGGPAPFGTGTCPLCYGAGVIELESNETIDLAIIWDSKKWYGPIPNDVLANPEQYVQTLCRYTLIDKLAGASEITLNTDNETWRTNKFSRFSAPKPLGFGADDYILTFWQRIS